MPVHHNEDPFLRNLGRTLEGAAAHNQRPGRQYSIAPPNKLSNSTRFAIIDNKADECLLRVDRPHRNVPHSHVNLNSTLTRRPDPHTEIPDWLVTASEHGGKACQDMGKGLLVASLFVDAIRVVSAVDRDVTRDGNVGKDTLMTLASIADGWIGGTIGSAQGDVVGAGIGRAAGDVPGAAIGSMLGGILGGVAGTECTTLEQMVENAYESG